MQADRVELGQNVDAVQAAVDAIGQRDVDEAVFSRHRDGWLGAELGERVQARSPAATQHKSQHVLHAVPRPANSERPLVMIAMVTQSEPTGNRGRNWRARKPGPFPRNRRQGPFSRGNLAPRRPISGDRDRTRARRRNSASRPGRAARGQIAWQQCARERGQARRCTPSQSPFPGKGTGTSLRPSQSPFARQESGRIRRAPGHWRTGLAADRSQRTERIFRCQRFVRKCRDDGCSTWEVLGDSRGKRGSEDVLSMAV